MRYLVCPIRWIEIRDWLEKLNLYPNFSYSVHQNQNNDILRYQNIKIRCPCQCAIYKIARKYVTCDNTPSSKCILVSCWITIYKYDLKWYAGMLTWNHWYHSRIVTVSLMVVLITQLLSSNFLPAWNFNSSFKSYSNKQDTCQTKYKHSKTFYAVYDTW